MGNMGILEGGNMGRCGGGMMKMGAVKVRR